MPKHLDDIEFDLCAAIANGIDHADTYPNAHVKMNGALAIECEKNIDKLQAFAELFSNLCQQNNIPRLPSPEGHYWSKTVHVVDAQEIHTFTFNITPEDMDNLLMIESENYQGYRNAQGSGSILLLANPLLKAYKEGAICAFPVLMMEDNQVMLRIAGCNASELISTQLTYFITQFLPPETYNHSTKRYGHWGSEIVDCLMSNNEALVNAAIQCFSDIKKHIYQQSMDGFDRLPLRSKMIQWIKPMDETNKSIYRLLGVVSETELEQLKSLEIPIEIYLKKLIETTQAWLQEYEPGGDQALGGKYYYASNEVFNKRYVEQLRTNIKNITLLLENINAVHGLELSSKTVSSSGLFKAFDDKKDTAGIVALLTPAPVNL